MRLVEHGVDRRRQRALVAAPHRDAGAADPVADAADAVGHRGPPARLRLDPDQAERFRPQRRYRDGVGVVDRRAQRVRRKCPRHVTRDAVALGLRLRVAFLGVAGAGDDELRPFGRRQQRERAEQRAQALCAASAATRK